MSCVTCTLMGRDRQEWLHNLCMCGCSVIQSRPTLCDPMDCSPPGSTVHGIFQASILQLVAISYSTGSSQPSYQTCISCVSFVGRWILYHSVTWEAPCSNTIPIPCQIKLASLQRHQKRQEGCCEFFTYLSTSKKII